MCAVVEDRLQTSCVETCLRSLLRTRDSTARPFGNVPQSDSLRRKRQQKQAKPKTKQQKHSNNEQNLRKNNKNGANTTQIQGETTKTEQQLAKPTDRKSGHTECAGTRTHAQTCVHRCLGTCSIRTCRCTYAYAPIVTTSIPIVSCHCCY